MAQWFAIQDAPLRVTGRGDWWHGQEPLTGKIADLFARHVEVDGQGQYIVRLGHNVALVEVDDTPFCVRTLAMAVEGGSLHSVTLWTSDGREETLDATTLMQSAEHVLYCRLRRGGFLVPCRFAPQHYHALALHAEADGDGHVLPMARRSYPIGVCATPPQPLAAG